MDNINNPKHPVILFIPEAGIYPFLRGLAVLGDAIIKRGGKVYITRDSGQMLRSPIMTMNSTPVDSSVEKNSFIYKISDKYIKIVQKIYGFSLIELSDFVDNKLMKEINDLVDGANDDLRNIEYKGFPVGKIAEYDFILESKFPYYVKLSKEHRALYSLYVKNTALTVATVEKICKLYKPSLFLTFNEYAQGQAVRYSAEKNNVRRMALTYPVHFNFDASKFSIWEQSYEPWLYKHCQKWNNWKDIPIEKKYVEACWDDSVFRMFELGSHIFSSRKKEDPATIFNNLKLIPQRKTIVVYTSSQDERGTYEIATRIWGEDKPAKDAFPSQIEWLLWLRKYANKRDDIQIVVRIHPREGSRQLGFESKHLQLLKAKFKKNTNNFIIIWPDDPVSSYDLMELADISLVAWSIMGQEAARMGIPVLSFAGNMFYPNDDFIQVATTLKEYEKKLDTMLQMKYTWQNLAKAVRFYHWRTFIPSLDLAKTVPKYYDDDNVWPKAPFSKVKVINDILSGKQDLIKYNIKIWGKSLPKDAVSQETKAMKKGIRYFIDNVFYPQLASKKVSIPFLIVRHLWRELAGRNLPTSHTDKSFKDYHLKYMENISQMSNLIEKTKKNPNLRILIGDRERAILVHNGKLLHRKSPLIIRLAKLHENI